MYKDFNYEKFTNYDELKNTISYIVKPGDSLYQISTKYDVSVNELVNLNKLASTMIYPNQVLFIPVKTKNNLDEYITKDGDTIKCVRDKMGGNINFDELKVVSNQVLKYNKGKDKQIVVDSNMTINTILSSYNLTPLELLKLNEHIFLKVGTKIIIK